MKTHKTFGDFRSKQELICDFIIQLIKVSIQLKHVYNNIITKTLFLQNKNKSKVKTNLFFSHNT